MRIMKKILQNPGLLLIAVAALFLIMPAADAGATIQGLTESPFTLTAKVDHISTADGGSVLLWGYANGIGRAQYPGPTLILNQNQAVSITLKNSLPLAAGNVSIVFPGLDVTATGGVAGLLAQEAKQTDDPATIGVDESTVVYTFTASKPGTYLYHSGTNPELQVEMGLVGAIIVRPALGPNYAYNSPDTQFDLEYLFFLSEMDPRIHQTVEFQGVAALAGTDYLSNYSPNYWFINGRTAMDDLSAPFNPILPTQPYSALALMRPGDRLLMRIVGAGRDFHPFHFHGNHARVIARQGTLLESAPGAGPDLSHEVFTILSVPGETVDAIFQWTGQKLGWDIYGTAAHSCNAGPDGFDPVTKEWCADHGKPFPVQLPETQFFTIGPFYSGSPFMGASGALPPGEGGLNPWGGFAHMWHSHNEKELTNYNIFPGGMMTMMIIVPPGTQIP